MAKKDKLELTAEKRQTLGRKVKSLRRQGFLPANLYGKKVQSTAVQVDLKSFLNTFKESGETGLINLTIKGEKKTRPVLIHHVQFQPVSEQPIHADFYQVDLKVKVTTEVPIELIGESPAVKEKLGILIQPLTEVEVEALPADLPDKLELDISGLKKVDEAVTVADLKMSAGVKVLTLKEEVLAKIEPMAQEEEIAPPVEEEVAKEAEVIEEKPTEAEAREKETGKVPAEEESQEKPKEAKTEKKAKEK
jgi:large subunit ribosomal protein L25